MGLRVISQVCWFTVVHGRFSRTLPQTPGAGKARTESRAAFAVNVSRSNVSCRCPTCQRQRRTLYGRSTPFTPLRDSLLSEACQFHFARHIIVFFLSSLTQCPILEGNLPPVSQHLPSIGLFLRCFHRVKPLNKLMEYTATILPLKGTPFSPVAVA